jgi:hypothetical protein
MMSHPSVSRSNGTPSSNATAPFSNGELIERPDESDGADQQVA